MNRTFAATSLSNWLGVLMCVNVSRLSQTFHVYKIQNSNLFGGKIVRECACCYPLLNSVSPLLVMAVQQL